MRQNNGFELPPEYQLDKDAVHSAEPQRLDGTDPFNDAGLDECVDRLCETDLHLARLADSELASRVADEIFEQNQDWRTGVRGLDRLTPRHFDRKHPLGYSRFDEQLYTYSTEFANVRRPDSVAYMVYTDARNTRKVEPALEQTLPGAPRSMESRTDPETGRMVVSPTRARAEQTIPLQQPTPIEHLSQYRKVAERRLDPYVKGCQLNISFQCLQTRKTQMFAYKRGEFVFVAKCCKHCMSLFRMPYDEWNLARPVGADANLRAPYRR